jgi:dihydrofolate reductase
MTRLSLIAALAKNRVIGADNALPWRLPEDLKHFKALTMGHPVIMGRKTFESIGKPLPGRRNIVVTRSGNFRAEGCEVVDSPEAALRASAGLAEEVFVIGGAELYRAFLDQADCMYLTEIDRDVEGDARFPDFIRDEWQEVSREPVPGAALPCAFVTYRRLNQVTVGARSR